MNYWIVFSILSANLSVSVGAKRKAWILAGPSCTIYGLNISVGTITMFVICSGGKSQLLLFGTLHFYSEIIFEQLPIQLIVSHGSFILIRNFNWSVR